MTEEKKMIGEEYVPLEDKAFNWVSRKIKSSIKSMAEFMDEAIRTTYYVAAMPFRIPTEYRWHRCMTDCRFPVRESSPESGFLLGTCAGCIGILVGGGYSIYQATKGNFIPLEVLGTTNIISGIYELGRLPVSRMEADRKKNGTNKQNKKHFD